jgi:16S rRNA (guanine527-N7)-methyltransferase
MASTANQPDRIAEGADRLGVVIDAQRLAALNGYLDLLEKWNAAYNLTAVRSREAMQTEHILDSLALVPHLRDESLLDVGTGAGLPGLVVAIVRPDMHCSLLDSNGKKTRFLKQAAFDLGLTNVEVIQARIEDYRPATVPGQVVSRAFSSLPAMVEGCRLLLAQGARLLAMKGQRPDDEIAALPVDILVEQVIQLQVPWLGKERHLVCMKLIGTTK